MKKYINDKSQFAQSVDELDGHLINFEGHDRPRYIYPANTEAGYLGLEDWSEYWNKPTYDSEGTGDLNAAKFYSIVVVPYKNNIAPGGLPIYGEATWSSMPQQPSGASKSLVFNIPKHPQKVIKFCGFAASTETGRVTDSAIDTTEDFYVGYTLRNVETGEESTIYQNGESTLYAGLDFTAGDRYQILDSATQGRLIYAAEMAAASDVLTSTYYLRATIPNVSQDQYEMTVFAESADIWDFSAGYFPPPNANAVSVISGLAFAGGGISDETGKAAYIDTAETKQATATADEQIAASIVDDDYTAAGTARVMRLTLASALTGFTNAKVGSYITVTDSEDTGNDVEDVRVTRVNDTDIVAQDEVAGGELISVGLYNGTDTLVRHEPFGDGVWTNDWYIKIKANLQKLGTEQNLWSVREEDCCIRITADDKLFFRFRQGDEGDVGSTSLTTTEVLAADWDEGIREIEVGWTSTGYTLKIDGSEPSHTGALDYSGYLYLRGDVYAPIDIGSVAYNGAIASYELIMADQPTKSHRLAFNYGSGTTVFDSINDFDFTVTGTNAGAAFWDEIQSFTNTGDGVISVGPTLTDRADEDLWELICTVLAQETFTATTPVATGTGDGAITGPTESTTLVAEDWTLTCTAGGPSGTFSVVGSVSGAQADLTTDVAYSNDFFDITVADGAADWAVDDTITFTISLPLTGATFSVEGSLAGAQSNLTTGASYSNDYFTMTLTDGATGWAVGDRLTFNVIKEAVTDIRWIEFVNNTGVANTDDEAMKVVLTPNYIQGNTTGADQTFFSEGMVDAKFMFTADQSSPYAISWVDTANQRIGLASLYDGENTGTDAALKITSDYSLYFSDSRNPHRWRGENIIDIGDSIIGISSISDNVIVFCSNSVWRVPIDSLGTTPVLISDNVRCPAQFSISKGERYIAFYDGTGVSITDGVGVQSVTAYKAKDYLANINKGYEANIKSVYDPVLKRFEFVFPMGADTLNNYGLYITEGSWNCYPFSRPDCNALWTNYDDGNLFVYHGTSGSMVDDTGMVLKHTGDTDGFPGSEEYILEITAITGQTVRVSVDSASTISAGDTVTIYPVTSGGQYRQMIVETATLISTGVYDLTFNAAYDLTTYVAGDLVLYGLIPFDYGVRWTDFGSPQYKHQPRALHLEIENAFGLIYIEHYKDMIDSPVQTDAYSLSPATTKMVVPFRGGKSYKYGFRIRGAMINRMKINSFEIMFDTQV